MTVLSASNKLINPVLAKMQIKNYSWSLLTKITQFSVRIFSILILFLCFLLRKGVRATNLGFKSALMQSLFRNRTGTQYSTRKFNKAGYTATLVKCGWAGAVLGVTRASGQELYAQKAQKRQKSK